MPSTALSWTVSSSHATSGRGDRRGEAWSVIRGTGAGAGEGARVMWMVCSVPER